MSLFRRKKHVEPEITEPGPRPTLPPPPAVGHEGLRSVPDHRDYILSLVEPLPAFGLKLLDARGLALCEDIRAEADVPAESRARVNGWAVRAEDVEDADPYHERVLRLRPAGTGALKVMAAIPVQAGEPLPKGADSVIPIHWAEHNGDVLAVRRRVVSGNFVRPVGSDVTAGQVLMRVGDQLDAGYSALLATAGFDRVFVRPRPRVVVMSIAPAVGQENEGAFGHEVNSHLLAVAVAADGADVWRIGVVGEDRRTVRDAISDQLIRADLIIATGGIGDGSGGLTAEVMDDLGMTDFAELALDPGRLQGFGLIGEDEVPMLLLPGDPVAAFVSYQAFGRPVLRKLMGTEPWIRQPSLCYSEEDIICDPEVLEIGLGRVVEQDGRRQVHLVGKLRQHSVADLARANALVLLPQDRDVVRTGDTLMCWLLNRD